MLGALFGAAASLIGGAANRRAAKKANAANRPEAQVRQWEAAGINPIVGITQGNYIPVQAASFGDAIATAGGQIADGLRLEHDRELRETELKKQNEELRKSVAQLAKVRQKSHLQAYGGVLPLPSLGSSGNERSRKAGQVVADNNSRRAGVASDRSGGDVVGNHHTVEQAAALAAPDRDIEDVAVKNTSGVFVLDNALTRNTTGPLPMLGDEEPHDIWEIIAMFGQAPFSAAYVDWNKPAKRVSAFRSPLRNKWEVAKTLWQNPTKLQKTYTGPTADFTFGAAKPYPGNRTQYGFR